MVLFNRISGLPLTIPSSGGSNPFNVAESVALGDFDGDGLMDLGLAPSDFNSGVPLPIKIFLNQGGSVLADETTSMFPSGTVPTTGYTNFPGLVRDFNGDGRVDWLLIDQGLEIGGKPENYPGALNKLLIGVSGGTMTDISSKAFFAAPAFNHNASAGDVDGDGDLDIMVSGLNGPQHDPRAGLLMLNDGFGRFTDGSSRLPPDAVYTSIPGTSEQFSQGSNLLVDVDGDSRLDLVLGRYVTSATDVPLVRVYHQEATGNFTRVAQIAAPAGLAQLPYQVGSAQIAAGDLDSDVDMDLVFFLENNLGHGQALMVLRNEGGFAFSDVTSDWLGSYTPPSNNLSGVQLVDVNGDGHLDLYLVGYAAPLEELNARILLNQGSGKLMPATGLFPEGPGLFMGLFGDINNDARPDLIGLSFEGSTATPTSFVQFKQGIADVADFNNDGRSDVLLQSGGAVVDWIMQNGQYQSGNLITTGAVGYSVVGTGDFNGDGTSDVLLQNGGTVVDWIMQNGVYQSGSVLTSGATGYKVVGTGDFNGDGTSDILLQNGGDVVDWIMKNGAYQSGNLITSGATGYTVVGAGDFNGDGTSDILLQNGGTVVEWIMKNGSYESGSVITTGATGFKVVGTGDFNGDGTSDVLLQNGGTVVDWIMKNGAYQSGSVITTGAAGYSVVGTGDYNGDGTSDVLLQNGGTVVDWLMKNGAYQSGNVITTGATGYTVAAS